jgi:hypothetical protein
VRARFAPVVAIATIGALGACDSLLDVENPNNLVQEDIENPVAGNALSNGALSTVARGSAEYALAAATGSDELLWIGSRDAWGEIDRGNMSNPFNEFTDLAWQDFSEGRWLSDEAIAILSSQDEAGTIIDRSDLGRAYLWSGIIYTYLADWLEDYPFSDRGASALPIGAENMDQVYDQAITKLTNAYDIATSQGDEDIATWAMAQRARAKHAKAVWEMLEASNGAPAQPFVGSGSGAAADALAALGMIGASLTQPIDQRWDFLYSSATVINDMADWTNSRLEHRFGDRYIVSDNGTTRSVTKIQDPIDEIPSPGTDAIFDRFEGGGPGGVSYAPMTVVSVRELILIIAEAAVAGSDNATFLQAMNGLRSLDAALSPYVPERDDETLDALPYGWGPQGNLLIQGRFEQLALTGRLLNDHYRFQYRSDLWQDQSEAVNAPGAIFPISSGEQQSNECLNGQQQC